MYIFTNTAPESWRQCPRAQARGLAVRVDAYHGARETACGRCWMQREISHVEWPAEGPTIQGAHRRRGVLIFYGEYPRMQRLIFITVVLPVRRYGNAKRRRQLVYVAV